MLWSDTSPDVNTSEFRCLKLNTKTLLRKAMTSLYWIRAMTTPQQKTMSTVCRVLLTHVVVVLALGVTVNSTETNKPVCRQEHILHPQRSKRCVTDSEVYINKTVLQQHHCTLLCMRDPGCQVINFDTKGGHCLLGHVPCLYIENDIDFITTPMTMRKPCLKWASDIGNALYNDILSTQTDGSSPLQVARCNRENNKIPGKRAVRNGKYYYPWKGLEFYARDASGCEILLLSSECNIRWIPHDSTSSDPIPHGAVIGGQLNDIFLYVARKYAVHHTLHRPRYSVGYYDNINELGHVPYDKSDVVYNQVELLVVDGWIVFVRNTVHPLWYPHCFVILCFIIS